MSKYRSWYNKLISKAQLESRSKKDNYCETHHIIPKCMGGANDKSNLVLLTAREHFIAHKLLTKIYPTNASLQFAVWNMCVAQNDRMNRYKVSSHEYEYQRKRHSSMLSELYIGEGNPAYGKPGTFAGKKHTKESIDLIKQNRKGKCVGEENPFYGKTHDVETRKRCGKANIGKVPINAKPVSIDGINYTSAADAARHLDICSATITHRCKSDNKKFVNYKYI